MPFLQLRDSRYPLREGGNRIGWGSGVDVRLPDEGGTHGPIAVINLGAGAPSIAALVPGGRVALNGVGINEPSPLLHGDKVGIASWELRFADEAMLGDTVEIPLGDVPIATPGATAGTSRGGGRLVSQVDGREYPVGPGGLTVGRDATCDIVLPRPDISRRHFSMRETPEGYVLLDTSANGVLVNGARVLTEVALGRGDTIRVGPEEFRFHADTVEPRTTAVEVPALAVTGAFAAARRPTPPPAPVVAPPVPRTDDRPLLATLEVINPGPAKGTRHDVRSPRVDIGRGSHNDIVIQDESVSDVHAKLQRRDDGWYLVDLGSTNGTYLAGQRLAEDMRVESGNEVRFGGVKMVFRSDGGRARPSGETRVIVGVKGPDPKRSADRLRELASQASPTAEEVPGARRGRSFLWIAFLILVALVAWAVTSAGTR